MTMEQIRAAIELALSPGRFFVAGGSIAWEHQTTERTRWEIFHGQLLDHRQTREEAQFESWSAMFHASLDAAAGDARPQHVISLKLAGADGPIFVTRQLWINGEETYESAPNVIETRPALVSQRELVGTIDLQRFESTTGLAEELSRYVLLALVGTSRLPITSVESPLPAFSFGRLGYSPTSEPHDTPVSNAAEWIERKLLRSGIDAQARVLELALRAVRPNAIATVSRAWYGRSKSLGLRGDDTVRAVKELFNQVALTPYTSLVDNLIVFLDQLVDLGHLDELQLIDLISHLLRQLARHLNAYDLEQFHNQGANYPDALLLEALLTRYLSPLERKPDWFLSQVADVPDASKIKRLRRRALRGALALRRQYAGHPVPDLPTSPGENARVLAGVKYHVAEEQLLQPATRRTRLFDGDPLSPLPHAAQQAFVQSLEDLAEPQELIELGTALFLDRPLGLFKDAGYADRTPLVSYEAFSRQIALARLKWLGECCAISPQRRDQLEALLRSMHVVGLAASQLPGRKATGVVTLEDSLRAAGDFVITRTTRRSLSELLAGYDFAALAKKSREAHEWLTTESGVLLVRTAPRADAERGGEFLTAFDGQMRARLQFALSQPGATGYFERTGSERLRAGLRLTTLDGQPCDLPIPAVS